MRLLKYFIIGVVFGAVTFGIGRWVYFDKYPGVQLTETSTQQEIQVEPAQLTAERDPSGDVDRQQIADDLTEQRCNAITRAIEKAAPAVVGISVTQVREYVSRSPFWDDPFFRDLFPPRILRQQVKNLGSGFLISPDGYIVTNEHVVHGATEILVTMMGGDEYKAVMVGSDPYSDVALLKIDGADFVTMIKKTTFACSVDETRPALNGVLWSTKGDNMNMVATDGHRLSKISVENTKLKGVSEDIIIPPKVLNIIPKFISESDGEIGVIFGENNIIFNLNDIILTSRLIEGPYPNYDQVIPSETDKRMVISKDELASSVRRVAILSNSLTHQVKFSLKNNTLTISTTNADVGGEGKETIPCEYSGDALELGYNATYITDILGKMESDEVIFGLSNPVSAGVIFTPEIPKEKFLCLIMPLRLAD